MPYIIINDKGTDWHYYTGQGFLIGIDTSVDPAAAKVFRSIKTAGDVLDRPDKASLYAQGWRVIPQDYRAQA